MSTTIKMPNAFIEHFLNKVEDGDDRMLFLPSLFDGYARYGMLYERFVFQTAERICDEYKGGMWDFYQAKSNPKLGFLFLSGDKSYTVNNDGAQCSLQVDGRILGLIANLTVCSHASFQFEKTDPKFSGMLAELYHNLRDLYLTAIDELAYDDTLDLPKSVVEEIKAMSTAIYRLLD